MSLDLVTPFLRPVDEYLLRDDVVEVMFNDDKKVFVEFVDTGMQYIGEGLVSEENLELAMARAARLNDDDFGEGNPSLNTKLSDGSRVAATFRSCTSGSTMVVIRKFRPNWFTLDQLVAEEMLPEDIAHLLRDAVISRKSILVSGGTQSGKTTFVKALLDCIPACERIGVIEDTLEIKVDNPNKFRLVARPAIGRKSAITVRDHVKDALRRRPDRIIIGEVRGAEAFDLLDALNTGHSGSISTIHANSCKDALKRLASLAMRADTGLPFAAIQESIRDLIDICVHVSRTDGKKRKVMAVEEKGLEIYSSQFSKAVSIL